MKQTRGRERERERETETKMHQDEERRAKELESREKERNSKYYETRQRKLKETRNTARKVPPIKCPLEPKAIGKFIICAANTNALEIANRAVIERVYVCCAFFQDHTRMPTDRTHIIIAKTIEVLLRINPSEMCIYPLPVTLL